MDDAKYRSLPYYERLVLQIKKEVVQGVLEVGEKLPSVRDMAVRTSLNPNTVAKAYKALEMQGVIEVQPGRGTFIKGLTAASDQDKASVKPAFDAAVISAKAAGVSLDELTLWLTEQYRGEKQ